MLVQDSDPSLELKCRDTHRRTISFLLKSASFANFSTLSTDSMNPVMNLRSLWHPIQFSPHDTPQVFHNERSSFMPVSTARRAFLAQHQALSELRPDWLNEHTLRITTGWTNLADHRCHSND